MFAELVSGTVRRPIVVVMVSGTVRRPLWSSGKLIRINRHKFVCDRFITILINSSDNVLMKRSLVHPQHLALQVK